MPRMNLTDEETKLVLRQRELEDAHRAGWNKALDQLENKLFTHPDSEPQTIGGAFIRSCIAEMKK